MRVEEDAVVVGITTYAAEQLGDVVFVALPEVGSEIAVGDVCGEVESHKSVSELFAPVAGEVVAVNETLESEPDLAGSDPFGAGWLFRVRTDVEELSHLLDGEDYQAHVDALS
ncbi:glycine cleavage system H protein [Litorihabitans aurantiacus]|uniref:Glycine cleavage system H protein n=1 Tax=Litorihabitans aurantiacus TaxID=1930061 RepID=A0AA38CT52_9MICO|nr:glycine cleavage system H protein [Litorihabitans aurantiacus]